MMAGMENQMEQITEERESVSEKGCQEALLHTDQNYEGETNHLTVWLSV